MAKRQFKAESKRLLDLMINSIYTHKEIFIRELISNASDAIDKIYYKALTDEDMSFNKDDYYIKISLDKANRVFKISDTGIGMTKEELADNLGVIAKSGSLQFKSEVEKSEDYDIIGQFGVGFYSAFMVAKKVIVTTKALGSEQAYKWVSEGADGYSITEAVKDSVGTEIEIYIKDNTEDDDYDEYLEEYRIKALVKKYSDFIRYPIKMDISSTVPKADKEGEYDTIVEEQTVNSMVPIWRKNKSELSDEDYENFYNEKRYGFDKPLKHVHIKAEGLTRYSAILYIPKQTPFDFYTKDYEKGLELYANGVLIMNKCADLLPDYFSFVQGMVDSEDLSLNISRELLQHDRQLKVIAKNIKNKIKSELEKMLKDDREAYEDFYNAFGRQIKYGIYDQYGVNKDDLKNLLMFYSSSEKKQVTLSEYVSRMKDDQKYIYYASGESVEKIDIMPQTERVLDEGYEIIYFTEDVDEFAINILAEYEEKTFKSVSSGDLGIEEKEDKEKSDEETKADEAIFGAMKEILGDDITKVVASKRLKSTPVCLSSEGGLTIEMEKVLKSMPNSQDVKAERVLEINTEHEVFDALKKAKDKDETSFALYTKLLYNQALLMEGLSVKNPVEFSNDICKLIK